MMATRWNPLRSIGRALKQSWHRYAEAEYSEDAWLISGPATPAPLQNAFEQERLRVAMEEHKNQIYTDLIRMRHNQRMRAIEEADTVQTEAIRKPITQQLRRLSTDKLENLDPYRQPSIPLPEIQFFERVTTHIAAFYGNNERLPDCITLNAIRVAQHLLETHNINYFIFYDANNLEYKIPLVSSTDVRINEIVLD